MSCDIEVQGARAAVTVRVVAMPAVFDLHDSGRPTHATVVLTTSDLRALAAATAAAVEQLDATDLTPTGAPA